MHTLSVLSLSKSFGAHKVVDDVSFHVDAGEVVALIGPNGAGKTTTFNMINGQTAATAGRVALQGVDVQGLAPRRIARMGVARTFQVAATFASLTVRENVQMALMAHHQRTFRLWSRAASQYADEAMALLDQVGMQTQADRASNELAYGDVKRVELAMALAGQPQVLLMDEPTAGMAPSERNALMGLIRQLALDRNIAVLFTEHSMDVVFAYADRVVVLARGRIVANGEPDAIRRDPNVQRVYFGAGTTLSPARSSSVASQPSHPAPTEAPESTILSVVRLNAWYGAAQILFDVDMNVRQGEVVALMGRNGAGKSTTLRSIMGMMRRRSGDVRFMDVPIQAMKPYQISRLGLGYVPEDRRIFTDLTVTENLRAGQQPSRMWPDGSPAPSWTTPALFEHFPNLVDLADRHGDQMSGGEQQMLSVARTLMGNPFVVLLDEPSEGVAPIIVESMVKMIRMLKQRGVSVVLCEQNIEFAALVADRAYVLEKGQIRYEGSMYDLLNDTAARRSFLAV